MEKIRKIVPVSLYDIPGMERWLEEQAKEGLFPIFLDAWATFVRTGTPEMRFRIEAVGRKRSEPSSEQLQLYRQAGWEYALRIGNAYFLFYTADPNAPELIQRLPQPRSVHGAVGKGQGHLSPQASPRLLPAGRRRPLGLVLL